MWTWLVLVSNCNAIANGYIYGIYREEEKTTFTGGVSYAVPSLTCNTTLVHYGSLPFTSVVWLRK